MTLLSLSETYFFLFVCFFNLRGQEKLAYFLKVLPITTDYDITVLSRTVFKAMQGAGVKSRPLRCVSL